jgi:transposase
MEMQKGVVMTKPRRKFTKEFKSEVVRLVLNEGKSVAEVARDLDLLESSVYVWLRQAQIDAGNGPDGALTTAEKEELARLRKEVRELKLEREILKKATAFFAKESK